MTGSIWTKINILYLKILSLNPSKLILIFPLLVHVVSLL